MGSFWKSSKPGTPPPAMDDLDPAPRGDGGNPPPNPVNFPPCEGGSASERVAFSVPSLEKYISLRSFLVDPAPSSPSSDEVAGEEPRVLANLGVLDREVGPCSAVFLTCCCCGGGRCPGIYSRPSTLADNRSFHSSPTSPSYRSLIVESSKVRPSDWVIG